MKSIFKKNQVIITSLAIMIAIAGYLQFTGGDPLDQTTITQSEDQNSDEFADISDDSLSMEEALDAENMAAVVNLESGEEYESELVEKVDSDEAKKTTKESDKDTKETDKDTKSNKDTKDSKDSKDSKDTKDSKDSTKDAKDSASNEDSKEVASSEEDSTPGEAVLTGSSNVVSFAASAKLSREQTRAKNKEVLMDLINNENISEAQKQDAINNMIELTSIAEKETATETLLSAKGYEGAIVSIIDDMVDVVINKEKLEAADVAKIEDIVTRNTGVEVKNIVITTMKNK